MKLILRLLLLVATFIGTSTWADWQTQDEHWYGVTIDGAKSGWASETLDTDGELLRKTLKQEMIYDLKSQKFIKSDP